MKLKTLSITLAAVTLSAQATAATKFDKLVTDKLVAQAQVEQIQQPDFGNYKIEKQLALIPTSLAAPEKVIAKQGNSAIVKRDVAADDVLPGSLVRNIFTGNLAPISGNITVLLNDDATAQQVAAATGFSIVSSFSGTKLAVVSVAQDQDVLKAVEAINATGLVKEARIEVLEARHTSR